MRRAVEVSIGCSIVCNECRQAVLWMTAPAEPLLGFDSPNAICTPGPDDPLGCCVFFDAFSLGWISLSSKKHSYLGNIKLSNSLLRRARLRRQGHGGQWVYGKGKSKAGKSWALRRKVGRSSRCKGGLRGEKGEIQLVKNKNGATWPRIDF